MICSPQCILEAVHALTTRIGFLWSKKGTESSKERTNNQEGQLDWFLHP